MIIQRQKLIYLSVFLITSFCSNFVRAETRTFDLTNDGVVAQRHGAIHNRPIQDYADGFCVAQQFERADSFQTSDVDGEAALSRVRAFAKKTTLADTNAIAIAGRANEQGGLSLEDAALFEVEFKSYRKNGALEESFRGIQVDLLLWYPKGGSPMRRSIVHAYNPWSAVTFLGHMKDILEEGGTIDHVFSHNEFSTIIKRFSEVVCSRATAPVAESAN